MAVGVGMSYITNTTTILRTILLTFFALVITNVLSIKNMVIM